MLCMAYTFDNCVETVVGICSVFDDACGAICFFERVGTLDGVPFARFLLLFDVAGVVVFYSVFELIVGWSLDIIIFY